MHVCVFVAVCVCGREGNKVNNTICKIWLNNERMVQRRDFSLININVYLNFFVFFVSICIPQGSFSLIK